MKCKAKPGFGKALIVVVVEIEYKTAYVRMEIEK
jgi:hypothetical protein